MHKAPLEICNMFVDDYQSQNRANCLVQIISEATTKTRFSIADFGCGNHRCLPHLKNQSTIVATAPEDRINELKSFLPDITFLTGSERTIQVEQKPNAIVMLGPILGLHHSNEHILGTLKNARANLDAGGVLVVEVLHGPCVLTSSYAERIDAVSKDNMSVLRRIRSVIDYDNNRLIHHTDWWVNSGDKLTTYYEHAAKRFFFPLELSLFLQLSGFKLLRIGEPGTIYRGVDVKTPEAMYVCGAI